MRNYRRAFTLVEVLIVVVILGIIAAVALPRFSNASAQARASMLQDDMRILRSQIAVFKAQHRGVPPGYPGCEMAVEPTAAALVSHLTMSSTADGDVAAPGTAGYRYGPYMREMPPNPISNLSTVQIIGDAQAFPTEGDDSHGYIYQPATLMLKADSSGADESGKDFFDY